MYPISKSVRIVSNIVFVIQLGYQRIINLRWVSLKDLLEAEFDSRVIDLNLGIVRWFIGCRSVNAELVYFISLLITGRKHILVTVMLRIMLIIV